MTNISHNNSQISFMENISEVNEFILVGLTNTPELQVPLFIIFTLIYLITLTGNLGMIILILLDSRLHTPMYFFLSNLSLVDFIYSTAVTPKVMEGFLTQNKVISYNACAAQIFFLIAFATVESFLLAAMAFDRHAAVCKPLHYSTSMTSTTCVLIVTCCYISGLLQSSIHVAFTFHLSFCHSNVINHFFCDIPLILALSCSDTHINVIIVFMLASFDVVFALLVILNSYLLIFIAILRMHSTEGRKKAFSTCTSHLTTVFLFYGTIIFMYLQPNSSHSMDRDKMASVFYTMIIPMLNPLVYSLRNKEVKSAFKKFSGKTDFHSSYPRACHSSQIALMQNISEVMEFILVGLTDVPELQVPLFVIFTFIYLFTLVGNLGMLVLIMMDSRLHTPMYFFLSNLSFVDCVYASAVTPKVIEAFLTGYKIISYNACAAQMFFFAAFATIESFILASMAFDRHAAVCKPLHYSTTMTTTMCTLLVSGSYINGLLQSSIHVSFTFQLSFCNSNVVNHFFCDIPPLLALSCSDIYTDEMVLFMLAAFNVTFTLLVIFTSYLLIFVAILRMHSTEGRKKAISTCASHLTTVSIFYGTIIFMYLQPSSSHYMDTDKIASVFYTMIIPMLNPLVYSLRNKEVKNAFRKFLGKAVSSL
ncbi:hypothetical protein U0070_009618 [Myodes glareolus]|uniref:G-protein coupled receptors family 1 profile domain-containing protein n=2 Tax=Myodes glareolus TaxID=447135 RepID=A0AAW0H402_MYOGA